MNDITFESSGFGPMDYVMFVPLGMVGDGEPGDPLNPELQEHLRWMASIGFWPVDWIEGNEHMKGIWFKKVLKENMALASRQCEFFIKRGGYV